jgi:hypothetical protein
MASFLIVLVLFIRADFYAFGGHQSVRVVGGLFHHEGPADFVLRNSGGKDNPELVELHGRGN